MKKTGIIGAMEEEVEILKGKMVLDEIILKASMEFYKGTLLDKEVIIVKSGVGKVNAAVCAQILIDVFDVDFIINTGIAGSLKNEINIGDIVISTDAVQHDMDAREFGYEPGQIPRMDTFSFKADPTLIDLALETCRSVNSDIQAFAGRIVTGDQFIANQKTKEQIVSQFNGYCTEMEGAAIAQAAYLNKTPFLIIRAISDKADNSAQMDYPTFEKQAVQHSVNLVEGMLPFLN